MNLFAEGLALILHPSCILYLCAGVTLGLIFGSIPGLTTTMGLAVAIPISFTLSSVDAMALLLGALCGGVSGGLISAILLNIPGTPSAVATTFDGHPMAMRGEAGRALGIGILYSFFGTLFGFVALITVSPILASFALRFGPMEYFALGVFSLTIISSLVGDSVLKGLGSAALGMAFAVIGMAPVDGVKRLTFGIQDLDSGFRMLTFIIGFYALGALFSEAQKNGQQEYQIQKYQFKGFGISLKEFREQLWNMVRSAILGIGIGILPGLGGNISNLVSYSVAKKSSKYPEKFGTGIIDGIVASETSNNATFGGAFIPLLTLGVPGDNGTAMLLGVLMIHGITPGPLLFKTQGSWVYAVFILVALSGLVALILETSCLKLFVKALSIPKYLLMPCIAVVSIVGIFSSSKLILDVWICLIFGIFSVLLRKLSIPLAPMMISFILTPMIEQNLRRGLMISPTGSISYFLTSPIVVVLLIVTALVVLYSVVEKLKSGKKAK